LLFSSKCSSISKSGEYRREEGEGEKPAELDFNARDGG
jgi:hypothetical protein